MENIGPIRDIQSLPDFMQDMALVPWSTVATLLSTNVPLARKIVRENGVVVVDVSERKRLPRWGSLREFIKSRELQQAAA